MWPRRPPVAAVASAVMVAASAAVVVASAVMLAASVVMLAGWASGAVWLRASEAEESAPASGAALRDRASEAGVSPGALAAIVLPAIGAGAATGAGVGGMGGTSGASSGSACRSVITPTRIRMTIAPITATTGIMATTGPVDPMRMITAGNRPF